MTEEMLNETPYAGNTHVAPSQRRGSAMRGTVFVVALMVAGSLLATPFEYVDHWPDGTSETETEVVVPDNAQVTISTAEDVERVERLTAISIGSGAVVKYTASTALTLSAALSGTGAFIGENSALLTIAADNRALLGHQSWTKLDVEGGGTLELSASDKPAVVRSFKYNGDFVPAGYYTKSSGVGITGDGVLHVRSSTDGEPGTMVIVY